MEGNARRIDPSTAEEDRLLRPQEVAHRLGVSLRTVWRFRQLGILTPVSLGRSTRFRLSDVQRVVRRGLR